MKKFDIGDKLIIRYEGETYTGVVEQNGIGSFCPAFNGQTESGKLGYFHLASYLINIYGRGFKVQTIK